MGHGRFVVDREFVYFLCLPPEGCPKASPLRTLLQGLPKHALGWASVRKRKHRCPLCFSRFLLISLGFYLGYLIVGYLSGCHFPVKCVKIKKNYNQLKNLGFSQAFPTFHFSWLSSGSGGGTAGPTPLPHELGARMTVA